MTSDEFFEKWRKSWDAQFEVTPCDEHRDLASAACEKCRFTTKSPRPTETIDSDGRPIGRT